MPNDTRNDENYFIHEIIFCSRKLHRSTRKTVPKVTPASRPRSALKVFLYVLHFFMANIETAKAIHTRRAMFARNYANLLASRKYFPFNRFVYYQTRGVPVKFMAMVLADFFASDCDLEMLVEI